MHRILMQELVIDVPSDALGTVQRFWADALLAQPRSLEGYTEFTELDGAASVATVGVQDIGTSAARVHIDIESDDVEAEVARLVGLGAAEVARHRTWVVLRDPAGLLFCIVPAESPHFAERSRPVG